MKESALTRTLEQNLSRLVLILILIQPVMDVLSYWILFAGIDNMVTLLLRFFVLAAIVFTGFCLSRRRWVYLVMAGVLLVLTVGHVAVGIYYGYQDPVEDLTNLVRIYQLPATTVAFVTYLRRDPACMESIRKGFAGSLVIILLVELLATLTGTDPHTYANKGVGVLGWFTFANAQSAILSMLIPVALLWVAQRKKFHPVWTGAAGLVGLGMLYLFATRLSYAALVGCALGLAVSCLIFKLVHKRPGGRTAIVFLVLGVAAVLLVNVSPMADNQAQAGESTQLRQADIDALVATDRQAALEAGLSGRELEVESLRSAYEKYIPGLVGRFGLERVVEHYQYSTDAEIVPAWRTEKRAFCTFLLEEQPAARIFGLELGDIAYEGNIYDVENDFHGIYYLCGGMGLGLLAIWLVWFLLRILLALIRDFKGTFSPATVGFGLALICALAHAYFTAGVLRRPNANFYLAVILAAAYMLSAKKPSFFQKEGELP